MTRTGADGHAVGDTDTTKDRATPAASADRGCAGRTAVTPPLPQVTLRNRASFVSSRDVPDGMAEAVARVAHHRGCGSFDGGCGNRLHNAPPFEGSHRRHDMVWASVHIADLCNALKVTPKQLLDPAKRTP